MKSDREVQNLFFETGIFSYNGVLDDYVFGEGDEWYCLIGTTNIIQSPEPYAGPYKTYDEANDSLDKPVGYIYTEWNDREREKVRKVREERDSQSTSKEAKP